MVLFYHYWEFSWRVSDCEELVGGYSQEMLKLPLKIFFIIHPVFYLIVSYPLPSFPISDIYWTI